MAKIATPRFGGSFSVTATGKPIEITSAGYGLVEIEHANGYVENAVIHPRELDQVSDALMQISTLTLTVENSRDSSNRPYLRALAADEAALLAA